RARPLAAECRVRLPPARLRHQGWAGTDARLATGCARGRADASLGGAVGPAAQRGSLCPVAVQDAARGQSRRNRGRAADDHPWSWLAGVRGLHAVPPSRHQADVRLLLDRAHGDHHLRLRHGRPARQFRRPAADDHAQPDQVGDLLHGRARCPGHRHAKDRRHPRADDEPSDAGMDARRRRCRNRRRAALRRVHERIPDTDLGVLVRPRTRPHRRLRAARRVRRAAASSGPGRFRRAGPRTRPGSRVLPADHGPPDAGADRGVLSARPDGGLVPERRGPAEVMSDDTFPFLVGRAVAEHRSWPRMLVDAAAWSNVADRLGGGTLTLLALWGETKTVHMAVADPADAARIAVLSLSCSDGQYPSVGRVHPPAIRLERAIVDLSRLTPVGLPDARPWLDHGLWGTSDDRAAEKYRFLPVEGDNLHQVPVGPVHASVIEPGHFRFTADGETIVRVEERLGYTHKGLESLLQGSELERAVRLAGRCSGDSTVAYALAFSRAVETALDWVPPARAVWLRALMAELERLANHLGDVGAICNDASFAIMHAHCAVLRER